MQGCHCRFLFLCCLATCLPGLAIPTRDCICMASGAIALMRILQHDMLVLPATSSSSGAACIERKADCVLLSLIKEHLFRYGYKPNKTAKQHVIGKDPKARGSIEQQTQHASSHISTQNTPQETKLCTCVQTSKSKLSSPVLNEPTQCKLRRPTTLN